MGTKDQYIKDKFYRNVAAYEINRIHCGYDSADIIETEEEVIEKMV